MKLATLFLLGGALASPAFVLKFNSAGFACHWNLLTPDSSISTNVVNPNSRAVRFALASGGCSASNTAAELNAVRTAFAQWQAVPDTHLKFEDAGTLIPPVDMNLTDCVNLVYWENKSLQVNGGRDYIGGRFGYTVVRDRTNDGAILEADIALNGVEKQWITECASPGAEVNVGCVEAVALHEIGHLLGLEHSPLGGATMFVRSASGASLQAGLSADDIAAIRFLYPAKAAKYGVIQGLVSKAGKPVFGAAVFAQDSTGNAVAGTVTKSDGRYLFGALPPGRYRVRAAPLDPPHAARLCAGPDIAPGYRLADTKFLPTPDQTVVVKVLTTNTVDFTVNGDAPAFRITGIRVPTTQPDAYLWSSLPAALRAGQSDCFVGVASANLPVTNATLTVSGDGLSLGATIFRTVANRPGDMNFLSVPISVASNATPGLRTFIVRQGTNVAYAHGFLEIMPPR